jgi:hypothetical protein
MFCNVMRFIWTSHEIVRLTSTLLNTGITQTMCYNDFEMNSGLNRHILLFLTCHTFRLWWLKGELTQDRMGMRFFQAISKRMGGNGVWTVKVQDDFDPLQLSLPKLNWQCETWNYNKSSIKYSEAATCSSSLRISTFWFVQPRIVSLLI